MGDYYTITDEWEQLKRDCKEQPPYRRELNRILLDFCQKAKPLLEKGNDLRNNNNTGYFDTEIETTRVKMEELRAEAREKVEETCERYMERLDKAFAVSGKNVDTNVLAVLNPERVMLTQDEFDRLAEPFLGNHLMEAAFRTYAEKANLVFTCTTGYKEKKEIAEAVCRDALSYIGEDNGWGISDWVISMKGELFRSANILTE